MSVSAISGICPHCGRDLQNDLRTCPYCGKYVKSHVDIFPLIVGLAALAVGIAVSYEPISSVIIGRLGYESYGAYGFLLILAGIGFLMLVYFTPSTAPNRKNGKSNVQTDSKQQKENKDTFEKALHCVLK